MVHFCLSFCKNEPGVLVKKSVIFGDTKMTRGVVRKYDINVLDIDIGTKPLTRTLLMPVTHGSNVVATITMVLMPVCSTSTTTMAMPTTTTDFVLR